jgi:predicted ATPase
MISELAIKNFKRFRDESFSFHADGLSLIAGGNNSGKSSILQSLVLWDFCRRAVEAKRTRTSLNVGGAGSHVSVAFKDFTPLYVPSFKHLWTNLAPRRPGSAITLKVSWTEPTLATNCHLEFKITLPGRLRIEVGTTNVPTGAVIPRIAHLPPFAGLKMKEVRLPQVEHERLIASGLPGAVVRNHVCTLERLSRAGYTALKDHRGRVSAADRSQFFRTDPWRQLVEVLAQEFSCMVYPAEGRANHAGQVPLTVTLTKGRYQNGRFAKHPSYHPRDVAVEGSGFLQWLSVFALAVDQGFDVLLLDEADVHLHPSMQNRLLFRLNREANDKRKQILYVTHSTEILREADYRRIYAVEEARRGYLGEEVSKVRVIEGLGSLYAPRMEKLLKTKKLLIVEGTSDEDLLRVWAGRLGIAWPDNVVIWFSTGRQSERKALFHELNKEAKGIRAISLRDRDEEPWGTTRADLSDGSNADFVGTQTEGSLLCRKWRRRHIENYLVLPSAIARAANRPEQEVVDFLRDRHSVVVNQTFAASDCPAAIADYQAKDITYSGPNNTESQFGVNRHQIAGAMTAIEICDDVKTLLQQLVTLGTT